MTLTYGFLKGRVNGAPTLKPSRHAGETQYHLHSAITSGGKTWDSAVNVGTNDSDDLLKYKIVFDYSNELLPLLRAAPSGFDDLTGKQQLPALDFLRGKVLDGTGIWRNSDVMDGSAAREPAATLKGLMIKAQQGGADVYLFGRSYTGGDLGVHDVHMNQGSSGSFINAGNDHNDHNDIWQDGAVLFDFGEPQWVGYFTAFTQQKVPTDELGNPQPGSQPMT